MKKTNKKILFIPLFLLILLSITLLINNKTNLISNILNNQNKLADNEEEIELDNWEISTVFYDSTVNDGKTPLTEINWDASDGGYGAGETRVITVQLTIKNTNVVNTYEKNSISVSIPNLFYGEIYHPSPGDNKTIRVGDYEKFIATSKILIGANDANHSGYDWNFTTGSTPLARQEIFTFTNNNKIEEKTNFEDTFQIVYTVTPDPEVTYKENYSALELIEFGEDSCHHEYDKNLTAILKYSEDEEMDINSNSLSLHYERNYIHPWSRQNFSVHKKADKISSYDGLGEHPGDYIWVKYTFLADNLDLKYYREQTYPYYTVHYEDAYIYEQLPDGSIAFDSSGNEITPEDGFYKTNIEHGFDGKYYVSTMGYYGIMYIGYPKSTFNSENSNLVIENTAELWGKYNDREEVEYLTSDTISINLDNFGFSYSGDMYGLNKIKKYNGRMTNVDIERNWGSNTTWYLTGTSKYNGTPYDYVIGDDKLLYELDNGEIKEMSDNDYYFSNINLNSSFRNTNGNIIPKNKYDVELWIRKSGEKEYILSKEFKLGDSTYYSFPESENVVGFYFKIKDLKEGLQPRVESYMNYSVSAITKYKMQDITETGKVYNFAYLKIYENGVLVNPASSNAYSSEVTREYLASYDLENHGNYIQRSYDYDNWIKLNVSQPSNKLWSEKGANPKIQQDAVNERFVGSFAVGARIEHTINYDSHYSEYYTSDYGIYGCDIYDLLPEGMELISSSETIKNSVALANSSAGIYSQDSVIYDSSFTNQLKSEQIIELIKSGTEVEIKNNWRGTGRTWIHVKIRLEEPLYGFKHSGGMAFLSIVFTYKYSISYDSIIEHGKVWKNRAYVFNIPENERISYAGYGGKISDDGRYDNEAIDINENGDTEEILYQDTDSATINSIISSHQTVLVQASSDISNYNSGRVNVSFDNEYSYKLRVTTGIADVKNLVIYDSIENYAKDSEQNFVKSAGVKKFWQGEFLGVDTSYAEGKGYQVKVYYSESEQPGSLKEDNTWLEYNDSIDKTKVKSLAFEYLDSEGNPAILPANSLTYVIIKMKAPSEAFKTFAYNGCWTEWNAIDPITEEPVDFITGINSNIVRVALPSSVEPEDIDITLTKNWIDNSNSLTKRPESVTFRLIANNDYGSSSEVTFSGTGNTWSTTITVPKYDDGGEVIEYTIKEDTINLEDNYKYVPEVDGLSISNTLYKNIVITKNWIDNSNTYLTRPTNITVKVYQNGNYYKDLNITGNYATNTWTGFLSVPVFDNTGTEYTYTVDEIEVENYETTCENLVCTNLLVGEDTITINKVWKDNNNEYATRPSSINIKLKQNGNDYQTITLDNNWSKNITVPRYDSNGVKYNYAIEETPVDEYGFVEYNQGEFQVTNTLKKNISITVTKKWIDNSNAYETRPEELKITLLQNNNEYQVLTLTGEDNIWSTTIEVPKYDDNQKLYKYSIKELNDDIKDDYSNVTYSEDELTVTNTLNKMTSLNIKKIWNDHNNDYQTRPDKVTIKVLQNGEEYKEIELSGENNEWEQTIEDVPMYNSNGEKYTYTIQEIEEIERYGNITYDQTNLTITNELTDIPKVTLYFTVLNGYVEPGTNEIKYDEEGIKEVLRKHNIDPDSDYAFTFELQNVETKEKYVGKLSTKGVLEFEDIPYGDYVAIEGKDDLFDFVSMTSIGDVLGVTFTPSENGGLISIRPVGNNIIYGANIINKIEAPQVNPKTGESIKHIILFTLILSIAIIILIFSFYNKRIYNI
mgnify:CR=1 FL=1